MTAERFTLAVQTSQTPGSAALLRGEEVLAERVFPETARGGGSIAPAVAEILALAPGGRIDLVATALGPGSFTGARIGVAYAAFFAMGRDVPVVGVCDLAALAHAVGRPGDVVATGIVAHDGAIFGAVHRLVAGGEPEVVREPAVLTPEAFAALASAEGAAATTAPPARASAAAIGIVAARRFARDGRGDDPALLEPLYLRPAAPERGG